MDNGILCRKIKEALVCHLLDGCPFLFVFFFACDFCRSLHIPTQTNILKMDQNFYKLLENCVAFSFLLNMLQNKNNNENQHMHIMYNTMTGKLSIHYAGLKETDSHTHTHTRDKVN